MVNKWCNVEVLVISKISGHFEWASTITKKVVPRNGSTKHVVGHVHGCRGAGGDAFLFCWQRHKLWLIVQYHCLGLATIDSCVRHSSFMNILGDHDGVLSRCDLDVWLVL